MSETIPRYVAHVREDEGNKDYEPVSQHLNEVAEMASEFADELSCADWGYAAGMLHDIGKYSDEFQRRILRNGLKVDHSTAGAYVAATNCNALLAYCIAGHHGGLPDGGTIGDKETTLCGRMYKAQYKIVPNYDSYKTEIKIPKIASVPITVDQTKLTDKGYREGLLFSQAFFVRMLFSCLVDADYLCTERFIRNEVRESPSNMRLEELRDMLERKLAEFYPPTSQVNRIRCGVLDDCKRMAELDPGVFSLTVPTGGGKTYALMRFALHHATQSGRDFKRVICVEPYTSIIEQNAQVYRDVFGDEQVLEHHSNYGFEKTSASEAKNDDTYGNPMRLAAENWDVPIVVTTNVQLFESLFANKTSRCRKLHNIAHSIIVLDEAQMIPTKYLLPCIKALSELVRQYGCTVVLCTATQPALNPYFANEGLSIQEIASNPAMLVDVLKRVHYCSLGRIEDESLVEQIMLHKQSLCIVNSRRQVRNLYDMLCERMPNATNTLFHLSTLMHPHHRLQVLGIIRKRVKQGLPCVVISTSLVEAGVDLDFETVFRAVAGVDSMVQAAGRCNRENKHPIQESTVFLFDPATKYAVPPEVGQSADVARCTIPMLREPSEIVALDTLPVMHEYFEQLYNYKSLDDKNIVKQLSQYGSFGCVPSIPFAKVASEFQIIDNKTYAVIIPTTDNASDVEQLKSQMATRSAMRRLNRYAVNVYKTDRDALLRASAIDLVGEDTYLLQDSSRYSSATGLDIFAEGGEGLFL